MGTEVQPAKFNDSNNGAALGIATNDENCLHFLNDNDVRFLYREINRNILLSDQ